MRWLLLAPLLAGCPLPPIESGCHLPVEPAVDGRSVSFRVEGCGRADLEARLLGTGNLDLSWRVDGNTLVPTVSGGVAGGELGGLVLQGVARIEGEAPRLWKQGATSEAFAGVVDPQTWALDDDGLASEPDASWWHGLVGTEAASLLFGALQAERFAFRLAVQPVADGTELQLVWGGRGDAIALAPGASVDLAPLWIGFDGDAFDLQTRYAEAVPARPEALDAPRVGWTTASVFGDATEADVRRHADLLAGGPVELIEVGPGWAPAWGDWRADDGFPNGMAALANDLAAAGFEPGLWLAPLCVDRSIATHGDHPDWWVQDLGGDEASCEPDCPDCAVLDATHPDAAAWLTEQIRARVDEGWTHLRLDALAPAAAPGLRHDGGTGLQAYRAAMEAIDAGADDATLVAGDAPLLPSVGWISAVRSGTDAPSTAEGLREATRNAAARGGQAGVWWWNDPGAIRLAALDEADVRGALVAAVVSGGAWRLADDLDELPAERRDAALDPALLALLGTRFEPEDPLAVPSTPASTAVPVRWRAEGHVALLNLGSASITVEAPAGTELLTGETRSASGSVSLPPGDGQIWRTD